jgi:hypothetical protein
LAVSYDWNPFAIMDPVKKYFKYAQPSAADKSFWSKDSYWITLFYGGKTEFFRLNF